MGVVGLGVMGANLARNIESRGFPVVGYDLDAAKAQAFINGPAKGKAVAAADSPATLMTMLERPRRILVMVPAGKPVDSVIAHLEPHLETGDILIDGGNSYFADTDRRADELASAGFHFVGAGVSGGEEGALRGPAIMPGGPRPAWDALAPILRAIAAKAEDGEPCVEYMGPRGAGHYVKMVHNGIEYGDMQLIAEVYDLLQRGAGLSAGEIADIFAEWNEGELKSYLIEITAQALRYNDKETGQPLVDLILDEAQQKGTGKWMSQNSFDVGAPIPTVNAAVEARQISALKGERVVASRVLKGPVPPATSLPPEGGSHQRVNRHDLVNRKELIAAARHALYASKITSYAQGMALLRTASAEYKYDINLSDVAKTWRAGCIIRAALLGDIREAFRRDPNLVNLMLDQSFSRAIGDEAVQKGWRFVVQAAVGLGIPVNGLSTSLAYYDAYRSERLPANLTQAQRDFFGAHTYRRIDREGVFHTDWTPDS
jgi:6-phosphogluconate dehydrogenase